MMEKKMKECMQPHALLHTLTGVGLGLLVAAWVPALSGNTAVLWGVVLIVVGVVGDYLRK